VPQYALPYTLCIGTTPRPRRLVVIPCYKVVPFKHLRVARKHLFGVFTGIQSYVYGNTKLCVPEYKVMFTGIHTNELPPCNNSKARRTFFKQNIAEKKEKRTFARRLLSGQA